MFWRSRNLRYFALQTLTIRRLAAAAATTTTTAIPYEPLSEVLMRNLVPRKKGPAESITDGPHTCVLPWEVRSEEACSWAGRNEFS